MKNIKFILFAIILIISINLFSQEETTKETNVNDKPHQFEITLKRTNYSYTPSEYYESKDSTFYDLQKSGKLKNNSQVTYPVSFLYYNKNWNLYTEASYFKISYGNMYYNNFSIPSYTFSSQPYNRFVSLSDKVQNTLTRREAKINFYTKAEINSSNRFFYGLGIRNIYKENYIFDSNPLADDSIYFTNSYGLQAYLKYQVELASFVKLNISAEPFYTYGNRNRSNQSRIYEYNYYRYSISEKAAKNYFYGADLDFNFSFALSENLNLLVGYNYIYTKIRHEKNREYGVGVNNGQSQLTLLSLLNQSLLTQQSHESKDHLFGYYFGLNAKF